MNPHRYARNSLEKPRVDRTKRESHGSFMSREPLTPAVMGLPLAERVSLAQDLWQSIDEGREVSVLDEDSAALAEAQRRDAELLSGAVAGRTHEQVMEAMRQAIRCA